MPLPNLTAMPDTVGRLVVVAIGFSIPISVAADNILLAVVAVCFVARGRCRDGLLTLKANPVFLASLALFGALLAGTFYGPATPQEAVRYLLKYLDLLFIPIIAAFFVDAATRRLGLYAFAAAIALTLLVSSALYTGLLPKSVLFVSDPEYPVVFKSTLPHAILMAFGAFLFAQLGAAESGPVRRLWYVLAAAAVLNMVLLVPGRTGYVVLGALALYLGYVWWRWAGLAIMIAVSALAFTLAYGGSVPFQQRVDRAMEEYSSWKPDGATADSSSVGLRLEFYRNSLAIVRDHPLAGVGTGGFPKAYAEQAKGTGMLLTTNPHNEYLLVALQIGIAGLLLMILLFYLQWRDAPRLPSRLECHLARGLVLAMATGCLFNSLLLDHTEGLLYAWLTGLLYAGLQSKRLGDGSASRGGTGTPTLGM